MNRARTNKIVDMCINKFRLNLNGLTVFTECASGYYAYLPIIAGLADAKKIFAISKDSKYGKKETKKDNLIKIAKDYKIKNRIEVVFSKEKKYLKNTDILTNTGLVRPIDRETVSYLKPTAVIPLMYETWEFRGNDIDLKECQNKGILVLGTDEGHPDLDLYPMLGYIAFKLMFDAGIEIFRNRILLVGSGKNGRAIFRHFKKNRLDFKWFTLDKDIAPSAEKHIIDRKDLKEYLHDIDCIFLAEHTFKDELIGENGYIGLREVKPFTKVVHFCGCVKSEVLIKHNIDIYPRSHTKFGYLTVGADYLGPKFLLELLSASLKVAEVMAKCRIQGMGLRETVEYTLKHAPAQNFSGRFEEVRDSENKR